MSLGKCRLSCCYENLPLTGTDENGNTVNYYYYVVETPVTNYDVSYDNNSGIKSGAITVTNTATDNPALAPYFAWKGQIGCVREIVPGPDMFGPGLKADAADFFAKLTPLYNYFNRFKV